MSSGLEKVVEACHNFFMQSTDHAEPLMPHKFPKRPWQKVATDLFELKDQTYLLVTDNFSGYIEIAKLTNSTT